MMMKKRSASKHPGSATMFFLVLFSLLKLSSCTTVFKSCFEIEKQSLLSFKHSLQDPENKLPSWNHDELNCCKWEGVICSNLTGHVHQLDISGSYLSGKVSPSLLNLTHLKYLDLSQNNFFETIPSFIGSLTSLEYLNLSFAEFQGKIPRNIGNLSNLHTLSLESSHSLEVDSLEWLSGLSKLARLNMNGVDLSKASNWPKQVINKLPSLVELHLSECILNDRAPLTLSDVYNFSTSNLAILDLSKNYGFRNIVPIWIFHLGNLKYLDLSGNMYEGPIPSSNSTTKLRHIDLSNNRFNSSIPEWIYLLKDLEYLNLGSNDYLQDTISNSIENMTSLGTLDLSYNDLSGKIPRGITNLCKLQHLDLRGNKKLHGEVSGTFGNISDCLLKSLEFLVLADNQLSGHLTHQFGEFKSLRFLDLSQNSLSGVIPSTLGNLSSLEVLDLRDNKLTGSLPESMGQLSKLHFLDIETNMLEGVVNETHFSHLSSLEYLSASGNHLTLKVGPDWIPPFKLLSLGMGSWNFDSQIPSWLDTQQMNIRNLDLSNTGIYGNVPNWLWSMRFLNLSHNQLHGMIPIISDHRLGVYADCQYVYLGSNKFSGQLPRVGNRMCHLDLSNNSFSGELSDFLCNTTTTMTYGLQNLDLEGNHLTGELPNCFMKWSSLQKLNLANNNLSGRIPNSIGFLAVLISLNLNGNNFSGDIPLSIHNCTKLLKIDLSHNILSGNLPNRILTSLTELVVLILKANKFSGEFTSAICQLSSLQILDLSNNMFSGMIPTCIDSLTAMITKSSLDKNRFDNSNSEYSGAFQESASIFSKGREITYDIILSLVTSIDLSKNNLSGDIPEEITSLVELRTLNLSSNHLTGLIPHSIGNMKQLESLDFSINSLSGALPNSFAAMSTLNYLNVSCNNLTGRIPESTQLQSLNERSFIGNNLCGPPLTSSCNINGAEAPGTMYSKDGAGDEPEIEWLYVFISLGYAVGLSAFLTTLFLKRLWRDAFYEFLENMWDSAYVYVHIKWRRLTPEHRV